MQSNPIQYALRLHFLHSLRYIRSCHCHPQSAVVIVPSMKRTYRPALPSPSSNYNSADGNTFADEDTDTSWVSVLLSQENEPMPKRPASMSHTISNM
jgi:hypothetical protein